MPIINIAINDDEYQSLRTEYDQVSAAIGANRALPSFEQWLVTRINKAPTDLHKEDTHEDLLAISAIEKLITSLQAHGFALAHLSKRDTSTSESASDLADALVSDLHLAQHQSKRLAQLFEYYLKSAKEVADLSHVGITNRAYGALHEAYKDLVERTTKSSSNLGEERALGRAEGGIAVLVSVNAISREAAKEKISAFRSQIRGSGKSNWVGKVFGGTSDDD